jgi:opacity protein-like surface antigen
VKNHPLFFGALLLLGTASTQANAAGNRYISAHGGVSSINHFNVIIHDTGLPHGNIKTNPGLDLAIAAGKRIDDCRVEVEFGYQRNNADHITIHTPGGTITPNLQGYFSITTFMANGYYDFRAGGVEPYITAGIGLAEIGVYGVNDPPVMLNETHPAFGFQFGAGIAIPLAENIAIDLRYRYLGSTEVSLSNNGDIKLGSHNYLAGIRVDL